MRQDRVFDGNVADTSIVEQKNLAATTLITHLRIRLGRVHKAGWMHLHELHVNVTGANRLCHFEAIAGAVVAIRRRQMEDVGPHLKGTVHAHSEVKLT